MDLEYNLEQALERQNISIQEVHKLRDPPVSGVPIDITDKQLTLFLNACNANVETARKVLKSYYEARKNGPELFGNRDPKSPSIQQCLDCQGYAFLPVTPDGFHVVYHALTDFKVSNYHFENAVKTHFMLIDACLNRQGPQNGLIFLFDMKGVALSHLTRVKISGLKKFFHYLQDCLPCKLHQIHIVNTVSFFDTVLSLIRPFMKAELLQMLRLHKGNVNWDDFYANCIPKPSLPSDFGGDCPSTEKLNEQLRQELSNTRDYFLWEEKQRGGSDKNGSSEIESTSDTFKKLDID